MRKLIKIFSIIIILLIISVLVTPYIFRGKLLSMTKQEINNNLKAEVNFSNFSVSLIQNFPDFTISLSDLEIVGEEQFSQDTLVAVKNLSATVDIMSVFSGESIDIKEIMIHSPRIHLLTTQDGSVNYDIMISSEEDSIIEDTSSSSFDLQLQKIHITQAYIEYNDKPYDMYALMEDLNIEISGDFTDASTILQTITTIGACTYKMDGIPYLSRSAIDLTANIEAHFEDEKYTLRDNVMHINALELAYDGWLQFIGDDIDMDFSFSTTQTEFKHILSLIPALYTEDFNDIETSGKIALKGAIKGLYSETPEIYPAFDMQLRVNEGSFQYPDLPKSVTDINAELDISSPSEDLNDMVINLKKFTVQFAENPFSMTFLMKTPMTDPYMKAGMKGHIDLKSMKNFIPLDSTKMEGIIETDIEFASLLSDIEQENFDNITALGKLAITDFSYFDPDYTDGIFISKLKSVFSPQFVYLEQCDIKMGASDMSFSGRLENFIPYMLADETIKGSLSFSSHYLDAADFMDETDTTTVEQDSLSEPYEIIEIPGNINFVLETSIDRLLYDTYDIKNFRGTLIIKDRTITLENNTMNTLEGSIVMNGFYTTPENGTPKALFELDITDIDLAQSYLTFNTIQKLAPIVEYMHGTVSTKLTFNSDLQQDFMPVLSSLNGSGMLSSNSIKLENSQLQTIIVEKLKQTQYKSIQTEDLAMFFTINNGAIEIQPFQTNFAGNTAIIEGKSGLDQSLDYTIALEIPKEKMGSEAQSVVQSLSAQAQQKNIAIPENDVVQLTLLVGGSMTKPTVKPVFGNITSHAFNSIKGQVQEKIQAEQERLKQKAEDEVAAARKKAEAEAARKKAEAEKKAQEELAKKKAEAQKKIDEKKDEAKDEVKDKTKDAMKNILGR
ncbi:MAG: AsmA-like C-terminal region-containing protein [Bacteroidota bacterium]